MEARARAQGHCVAVRSSAGASAIAQFDIPFVTAAVHGLQHNAEAGVLMNKAVRTILSVMVALVLFSTLTMAQLAGTPTKIKTTTSTAARSSPSGILGHHKDSSREASRPPNRTPSNRRNKTGVGKRRLLARAT
jgi:hypothetical protein